MAFQPQPGQKSPGKYPVTPGSAYDYYGEQESAGWYYNPYNDTYSRNPNVVRESEEQVGVRKPKKPGLTDQLLPIGAAAVALEGGRQVGAGAYPFVTETLPGMVTGGGEVAGTTAATTPTAGAGVATSGGGGTGAGMMGGASQGGSSLGGGTAAGAAQGSATGSGSLGGTATAEAAQSSTWAGAGEAAFATYGIPIAVGLGAASLYDSADKAGESSWHASTAALDSIFPGLGWAARELGDMAGVKTGKHEDQVSRDVIRDVLYDSGVMDKEFQITLADGSKFDIGKDGKNNIKSAAGNEINPYDVDFSDPNAQQGVEWLNGLGAIMGAGDKKRQSDAVGMLLNAAQSTGNTPEQIRANLLKIYQDLGVTPEDAAATLDRMVEEEKISAEEAAIYKQGINELFDPNSPFAVSDPAALEPLPPAEMPEGAAPPAETPIPNTEPAPTGGPASMPEGQPSAVSQTPGGGKMGMMGAAAGSPPTITGPQLGPVDPNSDLGQWMEGERVTAEEWADMERRRAAQPPSALPQQTIAQAIQNNPAMGTLTQKPAQPPGLMITGMPQMSEEERARIAAIGKSRPGMMGGGY